MRAVYARLALAYYVVATLFLIALAMVLLGSAFWGGYLGLMSGDPAPAVLDSIGLVIIGFAVVETAKFIAEEEILRQRELRSSVESRRSITKFVTIVVIAASLEALVMVFQTSREGIALAVYPAILFAATMLALVALGAYQWLSSRIDRRDEESGKLKDRSQEQHATAADNDSES